jgi:hypothetical protein
MGRKRPEQDFQISLVRDLRKILPSDCLMTAFPAGGGGRIRGGILNGMGLVAGMPDLLFFYGGKTFGMEIKSARGRLSETQRAIHGKLKDCGVSVHVVTTLDDALWSLDVWSIPTRIARAA